MMLNRPYVYIAALSCGLFFTPTAGLGAQTASGAPAQAANGQNSAADEEPNPLKRERSDKEKIAAQKNLKIELKGAYKTWLEQDVTYIISDEERKAFKSLGNDEERDSFMENFWLRRNPSPDSPENEFREEHYRRIAYANEHYAAGKPGWKTDRGHIYISFGAPDSIDSHPSGGTYDRPMEEGGGSTVTFPFEIWHYRYLEGVGDNIDLEFVDTCQCGDFHFTIDRGEKDALLNTLLAAIRWMNRGARPRRPTASAAVSKHWVPGQGRPRGSPRNSTASNWPPRSSRRRRSSSRIWKRSCPSTSCFPGRSFPLMCAPTSSR